MIKGLTDRGLSFPVIGHIRKGAPATGEGPTTRIGVDLDHFRAEFDEGEHETALQFRQIYGEQPQQIRIVLPFNDIERFFECWQEAYVASTLLHRCDGEYVQWARSPSTGEVLVRDWHNVETGEKVLCGGKPVTTYITSKGLAKPVFCSRTGRLKVIVPELKRLACLIVHTSSAWDVANLSGQLEWYKWLANGRLTGLTFLLKRKPSEISTPGKDGKRVRRKKWLLSLEADPVWVGDMLKQLKQTILPTMDLLPSPEPVLDVDLGLEGEIEEGEIEYAKEVVEKATIQPSFEEFPSEAVIVRTETSSGVAEPTTLTTAPIPPAVAHHKPGNGGNKVVGWIQDIGTWHRLRDWAVGSGFYESTDKGAWHRMMNVLKGAGFKQFEAKDFAQAQNVLTEHYAKQGEDNE
mgnify:CR=1 FL=1